MAKQFKVLVNLGKDQDVQTFNAEQGAGQRGRAVVIKAQAGAKYQLVESAKRNNLAPDNIKAKRVGKNLHIMFETDVEADVIIEDYYGVIGDSYNGVVGKAENGRFYEYLTEDPTDPGLIPLLRDNVTAVTQALGGAEISGAGAAIAVVGLGLSPLLGALGLAGAAAAAASSGGTSGTATPVTPATPVKTTAALDPSSDWGVNKTDNKTSDSTPTISGKATPGALVEVSLNGKTYTTTADANGNYAVTIPDADKLPDGVYTPIVKVTSNGSTTLMSATPFTIDTTASVNIENAGSPGTTKPISGVTDPGAVVVLKDSAGKTIGSTTAGPDGRWSVTPTSAVPSGPITATATDPAGNTATDKVSNAVVSPLTPAITSVVDDLASTLGTVQKYAGQTGDIAQGNTNDTRPTVNGTGVPGSVLTVFDNTTGTPRAIGSTTVLADGTWSFTPATPLPNGVHKFSVGTTPTTPSTGEYPVNIDATAPTKPVNDPTGTNDNNGTGTGNTFSVIDNVGAAQGNVPANATIDDNTPVINGKGTPGDLVKIYDNGVLIGSATVGADGLWNFKPSTPLADGTHPISTEFVDPSGNTSGPSSPLPFKIDTSKTPVTINDVNDNVAPAAGLVQPNGQTNDATPTIDGKGTPGTVVVIKDGGVVIGSTTVLADGTWSFTPTDPLIDGPHNFTATGPDSTGAQSTTGEFPLVIDTSVPAAPSIDSATDDVGGNQTNPTATLTDDTTPTLNGKGEPGSTITLKDATGNVVGTAKVDANGNWNLTLLALPAGGTYVYTATTTDPAGNVSPESAPFSVILDTKADTTPPTIAISRNGSGTLTSNETITFTLSEPSTTFALSDIDVTGGTLSNFTPLSTSGTAGTGYTVYTATFTPKASATGTATIGVLSDKFNDNAGNNNKDTYQSGVTGATTEANNQVSVAYNTTGTNVDVTAPTVIVGRSGTGSLVSGASETITFTLSELSKDFNVTDIDVAGGTLSGFTPVGTSGSAATGYNQYVATFTPTPGVVGSALIGVASSKFGDAAGNQNRDTYLSGVPGATQEANNQIGFGYDTTKADTTAPTIAITRSGTGTLTSSETVYFTLSEATANLTLADIDVVGGTLSDFQPVATTGNSSSGYTQYSATFTPTGGAAGKATIGVDAGRFTDAANNPNKDTYKTTVAGVTVQELNNQLGIVYDTTGVLDTTAPTIAVTCDKVALLAGETATITFTLSEGSVDFTPDDIAVTGGALSDFVQSNLDPKVYTATFTPSASAKATISVASTKFSDAAGNFNADGSEVNNSVSLVMATISGALSPTSDSGTVGDNKTNDSTPTIVGQAAPGSVVTVTLNGKTYTTTASPTGEYSVTIPDADKLPDGVYTPVITATTPTGVSTTVNATPFTIDTVTQVNIENAGTAGTAKPISGTAEPGDVVVLKDSQGNTIGSATAGPDGRWSVTPSAAVPAGAITATATDPSGNTATDNGNNNAAAPTSPAITSVVDDLASTVGVVQKYTTGATGDIAQGNTNDTTPTINGTGTPGSVLTIYDNTTSTPVVLGSTTVDASGQWSFTPTTPLNPGVHKFSVGTAGIPATG